MNACVHMCKHAHAYLLDNITSYPLYHFIISQALEHDVEAFVSEVQRLEKIAHHLVSQGHFDTVNVNARQV